MILSCYIHLHSLFSDLLAQKRNKLRAGNPAGLRSPIASCFPPESSGSVLKFDPYAICLLAFVQPLSKWIIRDIAGSSEPIALFDSCGTVCNIENPLMVSTFEFRLIVFYVFSKPKAKKIRNHAVGTSPTNPSFQKNYWPLSRGIAVGHGHGRIWKKSSHKKKCRNPCGQNILSLWFSSYINTWFICIYIYICIFMYTIYTPNNLSVHLCIICIILIRFNSYIFVL